MLNLKVDLFDCFSAMDCDLKDLPTILKVLKKIQNNNSGYFD